MKSIAIVPGTNTIRVVDRPEPRLSGDDEIKVKVLQVGICGTDREEAAGGRSLAPAGKSELVIGHEMIGQVLETGPAVTRVKPGDFAVFTVRRGCEKCLPCRMNRSDMCTTGEFTERGIWGEDGYQAEIVIDKEQYAVRIPPHIAETGVLTEPMSIVEKAIAEAISVQTVRLPDALSMPNWLFGRRCLVAGLGPVGLLGALALELRGAKVYGLDIVDEQSSRPAWLRAIGGTYIDGRKVSADKINGTTGPMELILEAAGISKLDFDLMDSLATNGIYALTGIPGGNRPIEISGSEVMRKLVLRNQLIFGSVNAARDHFQMAVNDLAIAAATHGTLVGQLITHRHPYEEFLSAFRNHPADEIKTVIEWSKGVI